MVDDNFKSIGVNTIIFAGNSPGIKKGDLPSGGLFVSGGKLYIQGATNVEKITSA